MKKEMTTKLYVNIKNSSPYMLEIPKNCTNEQMTDYALETYYELYDYRCPWKLQLLRIMHLKDENILIMFSKVGDDGSTVSDQAAQEHTPLYTEVEDTPMNPVLALPTPGQRSAGVTQPLLRVASLNKIVLSLTDPETDDRYQLTALLHCFRSFTRPGVLMEKFIQRYRVPPPKESHFLHAAAYRTSDRPAVHLRIFEALKQWIQICPDDFADKELLDKYEDFLTKTLPKDGYAGVASALQIALEDARVKQYPAPKVVSSGKTSLDQYTATEIADQLTVMALEIFQKIDFRELLGQTFSKNKSKAPNVMAQIGLFNSMGNLVAFNILSCRDIATRKRCLTKWISVLERLSHLHNYDTLFSVNAGLLNAPVHRLTHTHAELKGSVNDAWKEILASVSTDNNFRKYRETLNTFENCLPYLGIVLKDLTFTEDGNPKFVDGLVNFKRCTLLYDLLAGVDRFQHWLPSTPLDLSFQSIINSYQSVDDRRLMSMSQQLEPKGAERSQIV